MHFRQVGILNALLSAILAAQWRTDRHVHQRGKGLEYLLHITIRNAMSSSGTRTHPGVAWVEGGGAEAVCDGVRGLPQRLVRRRAIRKQHGHKRAAAGKLRRQRRVVVLQRFLPLSLLYRPATHPETKASRFCQATPLTRPAISTYSSSIE